MAKQDWLRMMGVAALAALLVWGAGPITRLVGNGSVQAQEAAADAPAEEAAPAEAAASTAPAGGEKPAEGGDKPKIPTNALELLINSGEFGYMILLLSVVLLAVSIQSFMEFKPEKMMNEDVLSEIEESLDNGDYETAIQICEEEDTFMTRIINAGLAKMGNGFQRMEEAIGEESETQATFLHQRIGYIKLIADISPMLGLLGTVSGMVEAFKQIALNPTANAQDLAGGIYVALTTTLLGLCVAIPGTVIFAFLRNRVVKMVMDQGVINGEVLDRFRTE